jgi:acetylornithine deacetylase/succinyl-diaminopimelate desuccinylase-like protein
MLNHSDREILDAIESEPLFRLTAEMVRRPSVSGDERAVAEFMANVLADHGFVVAMPEAVPGRPNVVTSWGADEGPTLLLTGHSDTVPIGDGWTHDPVGAEIVDGRLYGRGSCDMKAGLAGMMTALIAAKRTFGRPRGRLVFAACIDEEEGGLGTQAAIREGLQADWAVIGEPTDLQLIIAAKGNCYFEVDVRGRGAHAGSPERGINAIYGAAWAIWRRPSIIRWSRRCRRQRAMPAHLISPLVAGRPPAMAASCGAMRRCRSYCSVPVASSTRRTAPTNSCRSAKP